MTTTKYKLPIKYDTNLRHDDVTFVTDSWATSQSSDIELRLEREDTMKYKNNNNLLWASHFALARHMVGVANVIIAYEPNDRDQVYGYIVYDRDILFYIYVKKDFRRAGVATGLVAEAFGDTRPIRTTSTTYSLSHYRYAWDLILDYKEIKNYVIMEAK